MSSLTQTHIANLALAHLGDHRLDDFDEDDPHASDIRDQWELARLDALGAYEWGFASRIKQLDRSGTSPVAEWQYAYDKPADWVRTTGVADDSTFSRDAPFRRWVDRGGRIETDAATVYMDYVYDHTTVGAWPAWFADYLAAALAFRINPKITTSQSHGQALMDIQKMALAKAKARDAQTQPPYQAPRGNWIRARRGSWSGVGR